MILIRGIKGEVFARKIKKGIVDCRDVLSALLHPPVTGYEFSDYYEKNLVKALTYLVNEKEENFRTPDFLKKIFIDYYIPHIYLTYFHILNERSFEWLDSFEDDYQFIALNVKIDRITKTAIGNGYFGASMTYVDSIRELAQDDASNFYVACMCSLEKLFPDKKDMLLSLQIYNTLAFALLCREKTDKFTDIENEFRIITYDCPWIQNGIMKQLPRNVMLTGGSGVKYRGVLHAGTEPVLKSNLYVLNHPDMLLGDILSAENGKISLNSQFKSINIRDICEDYKYLGQKSDCEKYIKKMIQNQPEDIYVERTVRKQYKMDNLPNAKFAPGFQKVEY